MKNIRCHGGSFFFHTPSWTSYFHHHHHQSKNEFFFFFWILKILMKSESEREKIDRKFIHTQRENSETRENNKRKNILNVWLTGWLVKRNRRINKYRPKSSLYGGKKRREENSMYFCHETNNRNNSIATFIDFFFWFAKAWFLPSSSLRPYPNES